MDVHDIAKQVTRLPLVDDGLPQARSACRTSTNARRPSNPLMSASYHNAAHGSMLKTEVCRNFQSGRCRYGSGCIFVHGSEDLRCSEAINMNTSKRQVCRYSWGKCPYGEKCVFQHDRLERCEGKRNMPMPLKRNDNSIQPSHGGIDSRKKTRLCNSWSMRNFCNYGSNCIYAHGQAELRSTTAPVFASESGNAQLAPTASVKKALPNHVQTVTASMYKLPPTARLFKWRKSKKIATIYGDWIDEEPLAVSTLRVEASELY